MNCKAPDRSIIQRKEISLIANIICRVARVYSVVAAIGTVWIFALMLLIVADVVGRNFFDAPIVGVAEIAARSVVGMVFLLLPSAAISGKLIQADFLLRFIRRKAPRVECFLEAVFALAGASIFAVVALASWPDTHASLTSGEFFGVQGIWTLPTFPFRLIVVVGSALTSIGFVLTLIRDFGQIAMKGNSRG